MDELSQQRLDNLLKSEIETYTADDRAFLRARRAYIPREHRSGLKEVLREVPEEPEPEKLEGQTGLRRYQLLQKKARSLGLPYKGVKIDDLRVSISTVEGPGSEV